MVVVAELVEQLVSVELELEPVALEASQLVEEAEPVAAGQLV